MRRTRSILLSLTAIAVVAGAPAHGNVTAKPAAEDKGDAKTVDELTSTLRKQARKAGQQVFLAVRSQLGAHPVRTALSIAGTVGLLIDPRHPVEQPVLSTRPSAGDLSSPFGVRQDPIRKRRRKFHRGLDFRGKRGDPVLAAGPGIVVLAKRKGGYGRAVYIDHGLGLQTRYAHLRRIHVKEGQYVEAGHQIGRVGSSGRSTGPHLHFEVRLHNRAVDPANAMAATLGFAESMGDRMAAMFERPAAPTRKRTKRRREKAKPRRFVPRSVRNKNGS